MNSDISSIIAPLSYSVAGVAFLIAAAVAVKDGRSFANRCFTVSLVLLGLAEVLGGLSSTAVAAEELLRWQRIRTLFLAAVPGILLLFSLSFGRNDYKKYLRKWKYVLTAIFILPFVLILFPFSVVTSNHFEQGIIQLSSTGKAYYGFTVLSSVLILTNLERTLRAAIGRIRWQIKFIVLGVVIICADWIYTGSQALLYSALDTSLFIVHPAALLGASFLFIWGLARSQFLKVDVYLSRSTIQHSITTLLVSLYLVVLGLLVYRTRIFELEQPLPLLALLVMLALACLGMLLLSDRLQERLRRYVTRHFKRPLYDYRKAWIELTEKTSSLVTSEALCTEVAKIISRTFGILSVNIWLCDEAGDRLSLVGSTVFSRAEIHELERKGDTVSELLNSVEKRIIDLNENGSGWADQIMEAKPKYFKDFRMRYIIPLQSGGLLVGIITLNDDRVGKAPLSLEDQDLLNAYSAQLAARLMQLRLSENLRKVQEVEAFQNITAFFVHDLKNIASRLSLTMQNLPEYFDNPEFRSDALKLIGESVSKMESTCSRLSSLKQKIELNPVRVDFNELVTAITDDIRQTTKCRLEAKLGQMPPVLLDPEQVQKVFTNIVMNAFEATNGNGEIRVSTAVKDRHAVFTATDNGCGMSRQFMEKMMFRPFRSTKKKGMGIGLFHSKMIVEAHGGKIEVESEEGRGSTFRVILPLGGKEKAEVAEKSSSRRRGGRTEEAEKAF